MLKKQLPHVYYAIYYVESELKQPVQWEWFCFELSFQQGFIHVCWKLQY